MFVKLYEERHCTESDRNLYYLHVFWVVTSIYLDVLLHICVFRHDNQLAE